MSRSCIACGFFAKNNGSLARHVDKCLVARGVKRRRIPRLDVDWEEQGLCPSRRSVHQLEQIIAGETDIGPTTEVTYDEALRSFGIGHDGNGISAQRDTEEGALMTLDDDIPLADNRSPSALQSTTSSLMLEEYNKEKGAGEPIRSIGREDGYIRHYNRQLEKDPLYRPEDVYSPFRDASDYAFARWLMEYKHTKGAVDAFFRNADLGDLHARLSFQNAKQWQERMHGIPHGIPDDGWNLERFTVASIVSGLTDIEYTLYYRDSVSVMRFLLGHQPFQDNLSYAPVQIKNADDVRVYTEMHTGEWWWETQGQLTEGATIVPILISTDKTQMTQHHGDQSLWPVYMTVGNLDRKTRRSQTRPSLVLLGLIPIVKVGKEHRKHIQAEVYHWAMKMIFEPFESLAETGIDVHCADGWTRRCHPIIGGIMVDYEEQVLITGVKKNRHCSICTVTPNERGNLTKEWEFRTPKYTQDRIAEQLSNPKRDDRDMDIHPVTNWTWNHKYCNVHTLMDVDILHQLLKGIVMRLINWCTALIEDVITENGTNRTRKRTKKNGTVLESAASIQVDERFRQVPAFTGLHRFKHFSKVKQWSGNEQKAMVRQLVPTITPLLIGKRDAAIHCARAIMDFVMLAQYVSHDENTLGYMSHALYRIDKLKTVFSKYRPQNTTNGEDNGDEGQFNIPKLHVMTHYVAFIRLYGSAQSFDTAYGEAAHKFLLKNFFPRTNKTEGWETQILMHNIRRHNFVAMEDRILHLKSKATSVASQQLNEGITKASRDPIPMTLALRREDQAALADLKQNMRCWRRAGLVTQEREFACEGFIEALAVFIRQRRKVVDGIACNEADLDRCERDSSWADDYFVGFHGALTCWVRDGKDSTNPNNLQAERIRCAPRWRGRKAWRRDHVWVQETTPDGDYRNIGSATGSGRCVGQVQLIVSVLDHERRKDSGRPRIYTGAFVEVKRWVDKGATNKIHGMYEVEDFPKKTSKRSRLLHPRRFYDLSHIIGSVHLVPSNPERTKFYVNNYINWDQYNTVYDPDFISNGIRFADDWARQSR